VRAQDDGGKTKKSKMKIRHSLLPKLALCGQYEGAPGTSLAAERGTKLDAAFRHAWTHSEFTNWELPEEDAQAIRWAIDQCIRLGGANDLVTDEDRCRIHTGGIDHRGTADGVALKGRFLIDLKSGQVYDYQAQMAAYALGLMQTHFVGEWTTHLLFCDQRQVVTHRWTYTTADELVRRVLANVGTAPVENDYCGWCAHSLTCPARVASKDSALVTVAGLAPTVQDEGFLALLNDPDRLGQFLAACQTLDDFRDAAKEKARGLLEAGVKVPGWRLQKPRASEYIEAEHIAQAVQAGAIGAGDAIRAQGSMSLKKAQALWSAAGAVLPDEIVQRKIGQAPLVASK
jgi:hypothetical protein